MGWKCMACGNTELFMETNRVETQVTQDRGTTRIKKSVNRYHDRPLLSIKCSACGSQNVKWVEVSNQDYSYLFDDGKIFNENHEIETLVFELTNKCDIDCIYCPSNHNAELDFALVKRILDDNVRLRNPIKHFELGWDMGNPLLHSNIMKIMGLFEQIECQVNVLTNGKNFMNIVNDINLRSCFNFTFFLDHPHQSNNDKLMGNGVFKATMKSFEYMKKFGFNIYMRLSKYNFDMIPEMKELADKYGGRLTPIEIYPIGKTKENMIMNDEMKREAIAAIDSLNLNKSIHFSACELNVDCTYQRKRRMHIDAHGRLSFCHFLSGLRNSGIVDIGKLHILELIQKNNKARNGFIKNKTRMFDKWEKPRQTSSPCSYCLHAFGINKRW